MAKKGMKRPERTHTKPRNDQAAVPEIQGKAKLSNEKANPIISGTSAPNLKTFHSKPHKKDNAERPISQLHGIIDTDLGRDNLENDITNADLQDL